MLTIDNTLLRFDEDDLISIIGGDVTSVYNILGDNSFTSNELRNILEQTYSHYELIKDNFTRKLIIGKLNIREIEALYSKFSSNDNNNMWLSVQSQKFNTINQKIFLDFFNIKFPEKIKTEKLESISVNPSYPLYSYQIDVLRELFSKIKKGENRVMIHMPTGSGKTRTSMNFICDYLRENKNVCVLWLAYSIELLEQAKNEFSNAWKLLGNRKINLVPYYSNFNEDDINCEDSIIISSFGKMVSLLNKDSKSFNKIAKRSTLIIMDEAHQAVAPNYRLLIDSLTTINPKNKFFLGLSATPGRTWNDPKQDEELSVFFNKQKVTLKIEGYDNPVKYLIDNGYLSKVKNTTLQNKNGIKLTDDDIEYLKLNFHLSSSVLKKVSEDSLRNALIADRMKGLCQNHQRIIFFGITKEHSILMNKVFVGLGLNSKVITSETSKEIRNNIIKDFKTPKTEDYSSKIICNYGILTTGFDAPETSCAVISRPTDSLVLYSQMMGRAIRGEKSGGNEEAEIVTVIDINLPGFKDPIEAFINWEDVW